MSPTANYYFKINLDGFVYIAGNAAVDFVIKNHHGNLIVGDSFPIGFASLLHAPHALCQTLKWTLQFQFSGVEVKS